MVAAAGDNTVRDFQKLKTSLHRQMVDVIDFHKAEGLSESELRGQLRSLADYLCTQQSLNLESQQREMMVSEIMDEIYGFGPIESLMVDPQVTDILINGPDRILVRVVQPLLEHDFGAQLYGVAALLPDLHGGIVGVETPLLMENPFQPLAAAFLRIGMERGK